MKKILIRVGIVVVLLVVVALAVVFFSLNSIVKKGVETVGPSLTKVDVKLGSASILPFSGSGTLSKLHVGNPEGFNTPASIEMGSIKVAVEVGSLMSDTIVVDEVNIQEPEITFESTISLQSNLKKILDNLESGSGGAKSTTATPPASQSKKKFIVKDLVINGGKINLAVKGVAQLPTVPLPPVHLQDIGTKGNAVTAEELVQQVLRPMLSSAIKAASDAVVAGAKDIQNLGKGTADQLNNAVKGVGDLFKKK